MTNPDAKRLYDDLINGYNSIIRPLGNNSDRLVVKMGLRLSQLIDVNLKNQIMTTNVFVEQRWIDYKLKWEPEDYGGVTKLHVPSEQIWLPDIVLYNNADGNYEITIMTKAILHSDGLVIWKPPAIYKSSCEIDVEYFPFDEQTCFMKFGSWTYDGYTIDLRHIHEKNDDPVVEMGMDLSSFYLSVEWDLMAVPARRKVIFYSCCDTPYIDITFNLTLRRKTLFYTFNLIIPCVAISCLSILVFYLPSDSGEKVSLSISIMLSLVVFFLLLAEIIPPTSLTVPLLGRYLLFTMILLTLSSVATIAVLNVNFRSPSTHRMAPWVKKVFIQILPKYLCMQRPQDANEEDDDITAVQSDMEQRNDEQNARNGPMMDDFYSFNNSPYISKHHHQQQQQQRRRSNSLTSFESNEFTIIPEKCLANDQRIKSPQPLYPPNIDMINDELHDDVQIADQSKSDDSNSAEEYSISPNLRRLTTRIQFLSQHKRNLDKYLQIEDDWKFVAMVLDRLFLWIFTISCISGAALIILRAPSLYSFKQPIDVLFSKVGSNH
ncbi:Acetylcholine receptor subunit alpha-like 1 [Dermatophagoides farinae]|uniref:Acetylcholine receptor subunit alpha-like 1 n=2 Tax=Dermatophagoides farinae TaxID=6954 RepID=A0A922L1X9_DERFA|nr:acetylcholine receptor subunit alpha-like protein 1-like protein 1 [Dermatophagoides farinae]KAH9501830.1 Acetylcholine receptor subunit alpha-like 1 [Dermatophagoides farinae]